MNTEADTATYEEKLQDPRWRQRSQEIRRKDSHKCVVCGREDKLEVHHLQYRKGAQPWEYGDHELVTLCDTHHRSFHDEATRILAENVVLGALSRLRIPAWEIPLFCSHILSYQSEWDSRLQTRMAGFIAAQSDRALLDPEYRDLSRQQADIQDQIEANQQDVDACLVLMRRLLPVRRRMTEIFAEVNAA